jgi:CheY-like chemotaxis protein
VRVLVVEDVPEVRQIIRWMLEVEGATVVEAGSAGEALRLAEAERVDVVLTDLGLPDMSGEAVIIGIRSRSNGRIPVAVVSGERGEILAHALDVGADHAFTKPVDRNELVRYLASVLKGAVASPLPVE